MSYTPDPYDDTQPQGATVRAKDAAPEFRAIKAVLKQYRDTTFPALDATIDDVQERIGILETAGIGRRFQLFTSTGTFTVPAGVTKLAVIAMPAKVESLWVSGIQPGRPITLKRATIYAIPNNANPAAVGTLDVTPGEYVSVVIGNAPSLSYVVTDYIYLGQQTKIEATADRGSSVVVSSASASIVAKNPVLDLAIRGESGDPGLTEFNDIKTATLSVDNTSTFITNAGSTTWYRDYYKVTALFGGASNYPVTVTSNSQVTPGSVLIMW